MPRRKKVRGRLIQKQKKQPKLEKKVKVIASKNDNTDIWTEGQFDTVEEAINYGGPILEVGWGTGRVAIALSKAV